MTKKIRELTLNGKIYFEFVNLNSYENFFLLSYLLVYETKAIFKKSYDGIWFLLGIFEFDNIEIELCDHEDFDGPYLSLQNHHIKHNQELRIIANRLLSLIRHKSKYFTSRNKRKKLVNEFYNKH